MSFYDSRLTEGPAFETQVWSLWDLYRENSSYPLPDADKYAGCDEVWKNYYGEDKFLRALYSQCEGLLKDEFRRGPNSHIADRMAETAITSIKAGEVHGELKDGPIIYLAGKNSYQIDAICQVAINEQFDPSEFEPKTKRSESFLRRLATAAGIIKPQKATALTVRLYADADYLDGAYTQGKGYEDVRGRVFAAMVARALRDCEDPEYVETYIMLEDDIAKSRFATLGELKQGGVHRQVVAEGLDGIPPISRRFAHYAVKNPGLGIAA